MPQDAVIVEYNEFGPADVLQVKQVALPHPSVGEVRVRIKAIGLNRADIMCREGRYVVDTGSFPAKLGVEASGIVEAVGEDVPLLWLGQRVSIIPNFAPGRYGTYGEVAILPVQSLSTFPEHLTWEEGASIWGQFLTAWGGLIHFGGLKPDDTAVVTAASSSTGIAALQIIRALGASSIAVTRTSAKRDDLLRAGATHVVVSEEENVVSRVQEITKGRGADVLYDPIGGNNLAIMVSAAAVGARLIEYGLLSEEPSVIPLFEALQKFLSIKAYDVHEVLSSPELFEQGRSFLFDHFAKGVLPFHFSRIFSLSEIADAHRAMEQHSHVGKFVVVP